MNQRAIPGEEHVGDACWMRRALELARRFEGATRPNPPVGAVIVKDGVCLGEGAHRRAGAAHAEVEALDACPPGAARGADLYVTLEPCCTTGLTPPCTERILEEGVRRVFVGTVDPNPRHAGKGLRRLGEAGVTVMKNVLGDEARRLIAPFACWVLTGLPMLTLKLATTLDGRIADRQGTSKWITGEAARAEVQSLRRKADVVMVGSGTVLADDPSLRCHVAPEAPVLRLIVDGRGRVTARARVLSDDAPGRTILATGENTASDVCGAWEERGAAVWRLPYHDGHLDLACLLQRLGREGFLSVLCEGGARLAGALLRNDMIDALIIFMAPRVLADRDALSAFENRDGYLLSDAPSLRVDSLRRFGEDICVTLVRKGRRACSPV